MNTTDHEGEKMEAPSFRVLFESVRTLLDVRVEVAVHGMDWLAGLAMVQAAPRQYGPEWDALQRVFNDWQAVVAYSPHQSVAASVGTISRVAYWEAAIERDKGVFVGAVAVASVDSPQLTRVLAKIQEPDNPYLHVRQQAESAWADWVSTTMESVNPDLTALAALEAALKGAAA